MDKDPEVGMTPPLSLVELNSGNVSVTTPMTLDVHTPQPDSLLMCPRVNGVHLKVGEKCHPDLLDTNTVTGKDGSGDQLNSLHLNILKGGEESYGNEALEDSDKSSLVVDGSGDFSSSIKRHNNGWSSKLQVGDSAESVGSGPSCPENRLSDATNETATQVVNYVLHTGASKQHSRETAVVGSIDQKDHGSPVPNDSDLNSNSETDRPKRNGLDGIIPNTIKEKDECLGEVCGLNDVSESLFPKNSLSEKISKNSGETFPQNTRSLSMDLGFSSNDCTKSYARRSLSLPESLKHGDALLQGQDATSLSYVRMDIDDQATITSEMPSSQGKLYTGMAFKEVFSPVQHSMGIDTLSEYVHMQTCNLNNSKSKLSEKEAKDTSLSPKSSVSEHIDLVSNDEYMNLFSEQEKDMHEMITDLRFQYKILTEDLCETKQVMTYQRASVVSTQIQLDLEQNSHTDSSLAGEGDMHGVCNPSSSKVKTGKTEQMLTNSGVLCKDLKRLQKELDPHMTDESSDEDECLNKNYPLTKGKKVSQSGNVEAGGNSSSDPTNQSTNTPHTNKKHEALQRTGCGRMHDGRVCWWFESELTQLRGDSVRNDETSARVRREKGVVELEEPIRSRKTSRHTDSENELIDVGGIENIVPPPNSKSQDSTQPQSRISFMYESRQCDEEVQTTDADITCTAARARPFKRSSFKNRELVKLHASMLSPARKFDYRRVCEKNDPMIATTDTPLRHHTPFQRFDGKFWDASEPSFTMWASMHYPHFHAVLSNISDIPLECYVNAYMTSNRGWHNGIVSKSNITATDKRRDERDVQRGTVSNTVVNNDPRLRHRAYHPRIVDRCKSMALHGDDRESRKRRGSTHSLDNKRIRTASGDSDVDVRSGASTPTYLEHSMNFQSQMKRKRNADGTYCLDNVISHGMSSHKIERLKYKDIETPRWEKIDLRVYLQVQNSGTEIQDELEAEKADQSVSAYCRRHAHNEVLEKKRFTAYAKLEKNKKDGQKNRVGSRANLPTSSREFLRNERSANCHKAEPSSSCVTPSAYGENPACISTNATTISSPTVNAVELTHPEKATPKTSGNLIKNPGSADTPPQTPNEKQTTSLLAPPFASYSTCVEQHPNEHGDHFAYWDTRSFPLTDEEMHQLSKRHMDSTAHMRSLNAYGRFAHLGREGLKLPRVDTNTAPKYEKNHTPAGLRHKGRHRSTTNNRKNSTSSQKSLSKRRKKSSRKDAYEEEASTDDRTDYESASDYDSEQTLTCSESDNDEYYPEDHVYDKNFPNFPKSGRRKLSVGEPNRDGHRHDKDYSSPKSTERRRGSSQSKNKKS